MYGDRRKIRGKVKLFSLYIVYNSCKMIISYKKSHIPYWRVYKLKKLVAALLTATLVFSSVGSLVFNDQSTTAEAKSYKSGKKSFNTNNNSTNNNSNIQKKQQDSTTATNKSNTTTNKKGGFSSGGLMKGLFVGGIAGLLFGSMFANMGALGSLLGFAINAAAIIFIVVVIRKIFDMFKKKKQEEANSWRS